MKYIKDFLVGLTIFTLVGIGTWFVAEMGYEDYLMGSLVVVVLVFGTWLMGAIIRR